MHAPCRPDLRARLAEAGESRDMTIAGRMLRNARFRLDGVVYCGRPMRPTEHNPVVLNVSGSWTGHTPDWASVEASPPPGFGTGIIEDLGLALRSGPAERIGISGDSKAWIRAISSPPPGFSILMAEVREAFEGRFRALYSDFVLAPGLVSTPARTLVMGIVNVTPDSFSDGGRFETHEAAIGKALEMDASGADIIDIGGESTRPGSMPVAETEELRRVIPVIEKLRGRIRAAISIDTTKPAVASEALDAGAVILNDVRGFHGDPALPAEAASRGAAAVLMHMKGEPRTMQASPIYADLFGEITLYLREGLSSAESAGIPAGKVVLDPGIGFGKTVGHNLEIIRGLGRFLGLGCPILLGPSRKSFIGAVLGLGVDDRLEGTSAAVAAGILNGARVVRVHDAKEMVRVARLADAIKSASPLPGPAAAPAGPAAACTGGAR